MITEATRAEGGYLINKDGYRYLQDYDLGTPQPEPVLKSMELGPRDRLSQAFMKELEKGNTLEGEYGPYVNLDIRHLGKSKIISKLPFVRELCLKYENIDPVKDLIPVRPVVHYVMGGIHTDINGATPLRGLYAAGETACVSINGANRLGSNSLTELLVFGARAGLAAAEFAGTQKEFTFDPISITLKEEKSIKEKYFKKGGKESIADIRKKMHKAMETGVGIYRDQSSLEHSQEIIRDLKQRFSQISLKDKRMTFNTELVSAIELSNLLELSEVIIQSALKRTESRGSHQRIDHVDRDDENFLSHTLAYKSGETLPRIEYLPVIITKWPPGERVYGK